MATDLTLAAVNAAIVRFGNYRVKRAQQLAAASGRGGLDGALLIAFGLRETGLQNIEGGAKWDGIRQRWVKQDDPTEMDVGWTQISRKYHADALAQMPGVRAGSWEPVIRGKSANDGGFCPRFEEATVYTIAELGGSIDYAIAQKVPNGQRTRFAIAAHNAGRGGAMAGFKAGDMDLKTAGGDYSGWVLRHQKIVQDWLADHPGWQA